MRVPYLPADLKASGAAFTCHAMQIHADEVAGEVDWHEKTFRGIVYRRPWFGDMRGSNLFGGR